MNKENDQYVIRGVGKYQLCIIKENKSAAWTIPLNCMKEDKIIKTKNKTFLVLNHAVVSDTDFINFVMNTSSVVSVDVNAVHIVSWIDSQQECIGKSKFKGCIIHMNLQHEVDSFGVYKIIVELTETNLFYNLSNLKED